MPHQVRVKEPDACASWLQKALPATAIAIATLLSHPSSSSARTTDAPPINVNGSQIAVAALQRDNSVFVPVRGVFEKLGAVVKYTGPASSVATKSGNELARMHIGSRVASVKGSPHTLGVAPFTSHGHVMIPLRLVSEAAGATVAYQASPRSVQIKEGTVLAQVAAPAPAPAATEAANAASAAANKVEDSGIPWWVWLLLALIAIGIILALTRRKKDPVISTS